VKRNIALLYGFSFFDQLMIVIALWVPYLATKGIGMRQFMELQAVFALVILCGELPSGVLSDLWGRKKTLLLGSTLKAVSFSLLPLWSSFALPGGAQREDFLRVPRDRDLHGESGNPHLLLSPGPPRGLWDRRLGTPVRLVGARNPVLDRLRIPAPAAGPEPGRQAQSVTYFPSTRRVRRVPTKGTVAKSIRPDSARGCYLSGLSDAASDHLRGGIFDYWGCPAPAADRVIAEVRALIERGRRPRRPHVGADGGCLLCEAVTGTPRLPLVAESAGAVGVLQVGEPSAAGHCVFFPRRHTPNLHDLDDAELTGSSRSSSASRSRSSWTSTTCCRTTAHARARRYFTRTSISCRSRRRRRG
jgi:hypothetical protein